MNPPRNRRRPQHPANRRRPRSTSAQTVARRHSRWLVQQLQRAGQWLRGFPDRLRSSADTAVSGRPLRPWADPDADPLHSSATLRPRTSPDLRRDSDPEAGLPDASAGNPSGPGELAPTPADRATPLPAPGVPAVPRAAALGRQLAPRAAALGRQLVPLARHGLATTGRGLRLVLANLRPLLRLLGRFFAGIGDLTLRALGGLVALLAGLGDRVATGIQRHRGALLGLLLRGAWWGSLALLLLGGRAVLELHDHAPLDQAALPVFALGLGLCALLLVLAAQARLRWAAFALGLGHGGLLTLVWVVTTAA